MDRDELRRQAKAAAISSLRTLAAAFAGDTEVTSSTSQMIESIEAFDVKPPPPVVGMVVIGEAVAAPTVATQPQSVGTAETESCASRKRPRRTQPAAERTHERTLHDFPIGCEVLIPRQDQRSGRRWNEYCRVVGHTASGQLVLWLPEPSEDEPQHVVWSLFSLGSQLGSTETRPLKRGLSTGDSAAVAAAAGDGGSSPRSAAGVGSTGAVDAASSCDGRGGSTYGLAADGTAVAAPVPGGSGGKQLLAEEAEEAKPSPLAAHGREASRSAALLPPPVEDDRPACEQLAASSLRRSAGRTRDQLNRHLLALGLHAKFGQAVVSARGGAASHLTFNVGDWNNLPPDEHTPFVWWLGDGPERLRLANLIDPATAPQAAARAWRGTLLRCEAAGGRGGTLPLRRPLHDAQLRPPRRGPGDQRVLFKDRDRQARIELRFVRLDEALAEAIGTIPE